MRGAGIYSNVNEVMFQVLPTKPLRIVRYLVDGAVYTPNCAHMVFKVMLKHDMSYAVDLSGAQYGSQRTVTPWKEYEAEMVA